MSAPAVALIVAAVAGLLVLANLAEARPRLRASTYGLCAAVVAASATYAGGAPVGIAVGATVVASMLPPVRALVQHQLALLHRDSVLHGVVFSLALALGLLLLLVPLRAPGYGAPPGAAQAWTALVGLEIAMMMLAALGAGLFSRRDLAATLRRLGLRALTPRTLLLAAGVGLGLVVLALLDGAVTALLHHTDLRFTVALLSLAGGFGSRLLAALLVTAGDEVLFRGALRPRLGNFSTSLLFVIVHNRPYLSWAAPGLFVFSMVLGRLWQRAGTSGTLLARSVFSVIAPPLFGVA